MSTIKVDTIVDEDGSGAPNFTHGATVTKAGTAITATRTGSDGTILGLAKDGTTVGSISTKSGEMYLGSANTGIRFYDAGNAITPFDVTGATGRNAAIDIGVNTARFKDLYLSGGVFLGGTGASNKLTDFETGTFTPSLTFGGASVGITYSSSRRYGIYTKIGNVVTYFIHLELTSKGSSTGGANITGLPFTATSANGNQNYVPGAVFISNMASLSTVPVVRSLSGTTSMDIYQMINSQYSGITNANYTNTTGFQVSGHYYVA